MPSPRSPRSCWLQDRSTGILMHPTSLHGNQGIGVLGNEVLQFLDFLSASEITYWQILPLGPTGFGDSPYSAFSAFAGNPYLIDLEAFVPHQLLMPQDLDPLRRLPPDHVDFGTQYRTRWPLLRLLWKRFRESGRAYIPNYGLLDAFIAEHSSWLLPYARFMALKGHFNGVFWGQWPEEFRSWPKCADSPLWQQLDDSILAQCFYQYLFFGQWNLVREHARKLGIEIIGDLPIFVALDSADVWANPELFELNKSGLPAAVAGVPPDYFAPEGQLWGNPLYNWKVIAKDGFQWWIERFQHNFKMCDVVRLDHFRGFHNYWKVPATDINAMNGKWIDGPGHALFDAVFEALPDARIIAEDLGEIDDGVRSLRDDLGLPGMAILQFAFDGSKADNLYLPHNLSPCSVTYTGTHDNDTSTGWYESASPEQQDQVRRYYRISGEDVAWDFIRSSYRSVSKLAIIPMQDLLALGSTCRMNRPGTSQGNWQWRITTDQFNWLRGTSGYLRELAWLYGR